MSILDLLFPPRCPVCGKPFRPQAGDAPGAVCCSACEAGLARELDSARVSDPSGRRGLASRSMPHVDLLYAAYSYGPPMLGRVLFALKRKGGRFIAAWAAGRIAGAMGGAREYDAVTFMPRRRASVREYGFDQAELLARELALLLRIPALTLLERSRGAGEQKELDAAGRAANAAHSMRPSKLLPRGGYRSVLLVDDVVTTGASMESAAAVLRAHGVVTVTACALCLTQKMTGRLNDG